MRTLSQFTLEAVSAFEAHLIQTGSVKDTYLLLAECEVRTASYGSSFFPSFYGPSAKRTEQTRLIRCLLYGFVDYSGFKKVIKS